MWECPVCKTRQADKVAQCTVCGYNASNDMERYPTLICVRRRIPSNAAKIKAYETQKHNAQRLKVAGNRADEVVQEFEVRERILVKYRGEKTEVTLPLGIREIGRGAFAGNAKLERIVIPGSVKLIADGAFRDCKKLGVVDFRVREMPNLSEIAPNAFANCEQLTYIWFPHTLKKIGNHSFVNCSALTEITIPGGVECLEESAFGGCSRLRTVILKNGVRELGKNVFAGCEHLETVKLPDTLKKIGAYAFSECKELRSAQMPDGLEEIGSLAFAFCKKLAVKKPAGLKVEGEKAYQSCLSVTIAETSLKMKTKNTQEQKTEKIEEKNIRELKIAKPEPPNIQEPKGLKTQSPVKAKQPLKIERENKLDRKPNRKPMRRPIKLNGKKIASGTCGENLAWKLDENGRLEIEGTGKMQNYHLLFSSTPWKSYRDKIKQVVIEEGVKSIGAAAFRRCANLQYVKLPKTLEYIGDYAFSGCTAMETIRIPANTKTIRATAFQKCTARVIRELVM